MNIIRNNTNLPSGHITGAIDDKSQVLLSHVNQKQQTSLDLDAYASGIEAPAQSGT